MPARADRGGLSGRRVMVTRSKAQAGKLVALLEKAGAEAVVVPTIEIGPPSDLGPLDRALKTATSFDWAVFTSANAVEAVARRLDDMDLPWPSEPRVAAVGPDTAQALRRQAISAGFIPSEATAEVLARELPLDTGARLLLPRSAIAPLGLVQALERRGARVTEVPAYTTVAPESSRPLAVRALADDPVDVVAFTSSSTVEHLVLLLGHRASELLRRVTIASIGPATTRTVEGLGLRPGVTAQEHTAWGLVEAIVRFYEEEAAAAKGA